MPKPKKMQKGKAPMMDKMGKMDKTPKPMIGLILGATPKKKVVKKTVKKGK